MLSNTVITLDEHDGCYLQLLLIPALQSILHYKAPDSWNLPPGAFTSHHRSSNLCQHPYEVQRLRSNRSHPQLKPPTSMLSKRSAAIRVPGEWQRCVGLFGVEVKLFSFRFNLPHCDIYPCWYVPEVWLFLALFLPLTCPVSFQPWSQADSGGRWTKERGGGS